MAPVILNSTIESASLAASSRIPVDLAEVARTSGPSGFLGGESKGENASFPRRLFPRSTPISTSKSWPFRPF